MDNIDRGQNELPVEGTPTRTVVVSVPGRGGNPGSRGPVGPQGPPGPPGRDGIGGGYPDPPAPVIGTELRFAKNGSSTTPPELAINSTNPVGWSLTQPSLSSGEFLWLTSARKSSDGSLVTTWSAPIRLSGVMGPPGAKGEDGAQGPPGEGGGGEGTRPPFLIPRGAWDVGGNYYGTAERVDIVTYSGHYYVARVDAGTIPPGTLPTNTEFWNTFDGEYENIATNILLAQNAYVGWLSSNSIFIGEPGFPMLRGWELGGEAIKSIQKRADGTTPKTTLTSDGRIDTIDANIAGTLRVQGSNQLIVGDVTTGKGMMWNGSDLILRGGILQDAGGGAIVIPRFRGPYNSGTTYLVGDQVTNAGSTYISIYASPFSGVPPTNTTYWAVFAAKGTDGGGAGAPGPEGPSYVRKYAKNGSTTLTPTQENISNPTGPGVAWSTSVPSTSVGEYVWVSEAKFESDGVTIIGSWSVGTRLTGLAGTNGAPGAPGSIGPGVVFRGAWNASNTYRGTADVIEVVGYGSLYYYTRTDAGSFTSATSPSSDTSHWNVFGAVFESVATSIFFAELAYINNLGVKNLKTAVSGHRIEILEATNSVKCIDATNSKYVVFGMADHLGGLDLPTIRCIDSTGDVLITSQFINVGDPSEDNYMQFTKDAVNIRKGGVALVGATQELLLSSITKLKFTNGYLTGWE